jgi:hypothetical protein
MVEDYPEILERSTNEYQNWEVWLRVLALKGWI